VAVSSDGNTILVGAPQDGGGGYRPHAGPAGAAWVFTRSGSSWAPQGDKLVAAGAGSGGLVGSSVALSGDGTTAVIGGLGAWVFTQSGSIWAQQGPALRAADQDDSSALPESVALSADGSEALVGSPGQGHQRGAAWLFDQASGAWTQQGSDVAVGQEPSLTDVGQRVALSGDGATAVVGDSGGARIFAHADSGWAAQSPGLTSPSGANMNGLATVSLTSDGSTALLGFGGQEWLFSRNGTSWAGQPSGVLQIQPSGGVAALSGDGSTAFAGAEAVGAP